MGSEKYSYIIESFKIHFKGCKLGARHISNHFFHCGRDHHPATRTSLTSRSEELGSGENQCFWVGMLPKPADDYTLAKLKDISEAPMKGQSIISDTILLMIITRRKKAVCIIS